MSSFTMQLEYLQLLVDDTLCWSNDDGMIEYIYSKYIKLLRDATEVSELPFNFGDDFGTSEFVKQLKRMYDKKK